MTLGFYSELIVSAVLILAMIVGLCVICRDHQQEVREKRDRLIPPEQTNNVEQQEENQKISSVIEDGKEEEVTMTDA
jgi:PBP1b-binding outer membrane lipoprotein LpoB